MMMMMIMIMMMIMMINTVFNDYWITKPSDQSQRPPDLLMKDPSLDKRFWMFVLSFGRENVAKYSRS